MHLYINALGIITEIKKWNQGFIRKLTTIYWDTAELVYSGCFMYIIPNLETFHRVLINHCLLF